MPFPDYEGRRFRALANSETGQVSGDTLFVYRQHGDLIWAEYAGGEIRRGHLLGTVAPDGGLDFRYHHLHVGGGLMTGTCRSRLEVLADGRYRLHESWQWTSGDRSAGTSVLEEVDVRPVDAA